MNYAQLFDQMHPRFFETAGIRRLPEDAVFSEQILPLDRYNPDAIRLSCPEGITFGAYRGPLTAVHDAVRQVVPDWLSFYTENSEAFCGFDGERIVSFCILEDMIRYRGFHIGGPGCVGTIPEYRQRGIGLRMVQLATAVFQRRGYDLSYIHYTQLERWYAKLGYVTVLRWKREGIVWSREEREPM